MGRFRERRIAKRLAYSLSIGAMTAALVGVVGALTWGFDKPLLVASLAPTAFEQIDRPRERTSRLYNVLGGQLLALAFGTAMVAAWGISGAPTVLQVHTISGQQLGASFTAVLLTESAT